MRKVEWSLVRSITRADARICRASPDSLVESHGPATSVGSANLAVVQCKHAWLPTNQAMAALKAQGEPQNKSCKAELNACNRAKADFVDALCVYQSNPCIGV